MSIKINYGENVVVVPAKAAGKLKDAGVEYISVLFSLLKDENLRTKDMATVVEMLAENLDLDAAAVGMALEFWRGTGVISLDKKSKNKPEKTAAEGKTNDKIQVEGKTDDKAEAEVKVVSTSYKKLERDDELPQYTTDELTALLEKRKEASMLIDECQRILGKMFNTHEVNIVIGLLDYLGLDCEYVLVLFSHFAKKGKKSLHRIEKAAFELYNSGIHSTQELLEYLKYIEKREELESKVRSIFGMQSRALSAKEKKLVDHWCRDLSFGFEIIQHAYDLTINATNTPSVAYANSILDSWKEKGLNTLEEIEAAEAERNASKQTNLGSFDTDDFFEAALERSYGSDNVNKS